MSRIHTTRLRGRGACAGVARIRSGQRRAGSSDLPCMVAAIRLCGRCIRTESVSQRPVSPGVGDSRMLVRASDRAEPSTARSLWPPERLHLFRDPMRPPPGALGTFWRGLPTDARARDDGNEADSRDSAQRSWTRRLFSKADAREAVAAVPAGLRDASLRRRRVRHGTDRPCHGVRRVTLAGTPSGPSVGHSFSGLRGASARGSSRRP